MGTRALIKVNDVSDGGKVTLLCLYKQHDGYFSGLGDKIHKFLSQRTVVNGISPSMDATKYANGVGDLAAQLVQEFKNKDPLGQVYIYPPDTEDAGQDFTYTLNYATDDFGVDYLQSIVIDDLNGTTYLGGANVLSSFAELIPTGG